MINDFEDTSSEEFLRIKNGVEQRQELSGFANKRGTKAFECMVFKGLFEKIREIQGLDMPKNSDEYAKKKMLEYRSKQG